MIQQTRGSVRGEDSMGEDKLTSVWQRILDDFYSISRFEKTSRGPFQQCAVRVKYGRPTRSASCNKESRTWNSDGITNVERRSRSTVVMNWTDATLGHYGEQLWSRSVARRKAVCALSGEPIKRGDSIYKPRYIG